MQAEPALAALANMSAPPRSAVTLPRLAPVYPAQGGAGAVESAMVGAVAGAAGSGGSTGTRAPGDGAATALREIAVGPGGGKLLSSALCLARVDLPTAVCARLGMGCSAPLLTAPLGLARALVAVARQASANPGARNPARAARLELDRLAGLPEGALVQELTARLEGLGWPTWVPPVAFARPFGRDIATGVGRSKPPAPPAGIPCPLQAARVVSAIRGPVFLRDAPPVLAHLLTLWGGTTPSGHWEIWLPVEPGRARPAEPPNE